MSAPRFVLGSPVRAAIGALLLLSAAAVLWTARTVDWGVAWTAVIPSLALLVPGWGLLQRRVLTWHDGVLTCSDGWLWRRAVTLRTAGAELEIVPTAGLTAVVLHRAGSAWPLATWIRRGTAQRLADWLDGLDPGAGPLPRRATRLPDGDR